MNRQLIEKSVFANDSCLAEDAVVEIPILLEARQLTALEAFACAHGLTAGTLVRCLLRDFLSYSEGECTARFAATDTSQIRC